MTLMSFFSSQCLLYKQRSFNTQNFINFSSDDTYPVVPTNTIIIIIQVFLSRKVNLSHGYSK